MKGRSLTPKQRAFVEAYSGNATEAARIAGYRGCPGTIRSVARENLSKPHIADAIRHRETARSAARIANREQRQAFWTAVMRDESRPMPDRLRASELLGKSEGDFLQRVEHSGLVALGVYRGTPDADLLAMARRLLEARTTD